MKKFNTSPISGTLELTPNLQVEFDRLKAGITNAFRAHGFQHIETPMIERTEVLLAKAGGDTEKQIYRVVKTAEMEKSADQALRFDHTVPLARYTVEHINDLIFPFKATQVARNFRGERAQKGRFREFYQCDVDIVGWNKLPVVYDAEVIATLAEALKVLPLPRFVIRVSNRKILSGLLDELGLEQDASEIFGIIDHAEKVSPEKTTAALRELGLSDENVVKITTFMEIRGESESAIAKLKELAIANETLQNGVNELSEVLKTVKTLAPTAEIIADMLIVRGLDYYTGTVFETLAPDYREFGSICSGGRYEDLAGYYTDQKLPGVGGSIGLSRLFALFVEYGLIKTADNPPIDVCLIPITDNEIAVAGQIAQELRKTQKSVDLVLGDKKLGDKMKYASRVAQKVAVIGEDETQRRSYRLRDLDSGVEETISF